MSVIMAGSLVLCCLVTDVIVHSLASSGLSDFVCLSPTFPPNDGNVLQVALIPFDRGRILPKLFVSNSRFD